MIEVPIDVFRNTGETALVCGFTRADGMWRMVAVTAAASPGDPSTLMTKEHGKEPEVKFYGAAEACDNEFLMLTNVCLADGYEPHGQVIAPLPPLEWDSTVDDGVAAVKDWANRFLRSASFDLARERPA
jgi:hypothetical protein